MKIFFTLDKDLNASMKLYKKTRESVEVSIPFRYKDVIYKGVIFHKNNLIRKQKRKIKGILFINSSNCIVTDKKIINELSVVFYNLEMLLDDFFIDRLEKTILSESDLTEEEKSYKVISKILQVLIEKNTYGAEKVDGILKKLPQLKKENNILIRQYVEVVNDLARLKIIESDFLSNDIKQIYNLTLLKNFEKIKLIGTGKNLFSSVKKETLALVKKKIPGIIATDTTSGTANCEYVFNYLIRVVEVYSSVLEMSQNEYIKYLDNIDKSEIDKLIIKNRA